MEGCDRATQMAQTQPCPLASPNPGTCDMETLAMGLGLLMAPALAHGSPGRGSSFACLSSCLAILRDRGPGLARPGKEPPPAIASPSPRPPAQPAHLLSVAGEGTKLSKRRAKNEAVCADRYTDGAHRQTDVCRQISNVTMAHTWLSVCVGHHPSISHIFMYRILTTTL